MEDKKEIKKAVGILKSGGIIIFPSESCYSLGCNVFNSTAIKRIRKIKHDDKKKPYSIIISNINQIKKVGILNKESNKLIKNLMPSQLNLIISKKKGKFLELAYNNSISFRIPANKIALELVKKLKKPIITTSLNIHGMPSIYSIKEAKKQFQDKVDYILDSGNLNKKNKVSTIYDTRTNRIIRKGPISLKQINKVLK